MTVEIANRVSSIEDRGLTPPRRRLAVAAIAVCLLAAPVIAVAQDLPDGPGRALATGRCTSCHGTDLIQQQRLSKAAWVREVGKMAGWGARLDEAERETLAAYLAEHFGTTPAVSHAAAGASTAAGEQTLQRACRACHGLDMVTQQQLTREAWSREVDKMVRWGAHVADADKGALVDFLAAHHGPVPR